MLAQRSPATEWFRFKFGTPTAAQLAAWPAIEQDLNVLLVSPTGTGKTLAAFLGVLSKLTLEAEKGRIKPGIRALYISPLRALSYDLEKNLAVPLRDIYGDDPPIAVGLRSGDTSSAERRRQSIKPPHILLTTPESLAILLTQSRWHTALASVQWVIVDEIHSLAENKRGSHLSLSLERLDRLRRENAPEGASLQRIGLSATVAPLEQVARFLCGQASCEILDVSSAKKFDLRVYSPLAKHPYPVSGYTGERLIKELARLIAQNRTTLIFSNTRSGAEAATFWLHNALPELAGQIECHHASLDRDVRQEVEDRLKRGELRAVVCSTSLELGIDIGSIDLVVMLSTPKGVSKALQRTGRSGHSIHMVSRGLLMATNMNDLVECCATAVLARSRQLDPVRIPEAPLDVLAQHLASMGCVRRWGRTEAYELARRAYPYRNLTETEFNATLDYLAGGGRALRQQYTDVFGKIHLDDQGFETRQGAVRRDMLQNIGVIPNEGSVAVRLGRRTLGMVEEIFIRNLRPGDVFVIAGRPVKLNRVGFMDCFVERADNATPTIPRWNANKMPLTNKVAEEIVAFRGELRARFAVEGTEAERHNDWVSQRLECGPSNAAIIARMYAAQAAVSDIPTADYLLVESLEHSEAAGVDVQAAATAKSKRKKTGLLHGPQQWHYFFHSLVGRAANEALSRVVALRLSRLRSGNAIATADDYGFVLTVRPEQKISEVNLPFLLEPEGFAADLDEALSRSELLKYHFRNAAQTGMMVYRNFFGEQKSVKKLQWSSEVIFNVLREHEPDHILLREARRDAVHTYIDLAGALAFLRGANNKPMRIVPVQRVPPLSFALFATKIKEALLVEDPREMTERLFHLWWNKLQPDERVTES